MFVGMLKEMLQLDAAKRIKPRELLKHQFIRMYPLSSVQNKHNHKYQTYDKKIVGNLLFSECFWLSGTIGLSAPGINLTRLESLCENASRVNLLFKRHYLQRSGHNFFYVAVNCVQSKCSLLLLSWTIYLLVCPSLADTSRTVFCEFVTDKE